MFKIIFTLLVCLLGISYEPVAIANNLVAFGNGVVAAIEKHPSQNYVNLRNSTDYGAHWNTLSDNSDGRCGSRHLNSIKYMDIRKEFIVVGNNDSIENSRASSKTEEEQIANNGTICTSTDGRQWAWRSAKQGILPDADLYDVTYGEVVRGGKTNVVVVAVGYGGTTLYATLPANDPNPMDDWDFKPTNSETANNLYSVTYGAGTFVAVGEYATIVYSTDGKNWQPANTTGLATFNRVIFTKQSTNSTAQPNLFVAVANDATIWTSPDGKTWFQGNIVGNNSDGAFVDVAYKPDTSGAKGVFVAVGEGIAAYSNGVADSTGVVTWNTYDPSSTIGGNINSIIYSAKNNKFIATYTYKNEDVELGNTAYSEDGITWKPDSISNHFIGPLAGLTATDTNLIATPYGNGSDNAPSLVLITTDPLNWKTVQQEWR